jgi:formate/nitrite transporter FocA (FNT family)
VVVARPEQQSERSPTPEPAAGTRFSADEIYENVRIAAEKEMERPPAALLWSAVTAGLTIAFSFLAGAYLTTLVPDRFAGAAAAAGYPLGFVFVVLARNQLFTENTLEPIIPLLNEPSGAKLRGLLSIWGIVLAGNLVGAMVVAWLLCRTPLVDAGLQTSLARLAEHGTRGGFTEVAYRAVFAGWLIALMAWLISSTRATGAQLALVWLTTAPISALGFRHSIAGAVEAFYRLFAGTMSWRELGVDFLSAALIGNVCGGVLFVALLNHGQVAAGRPVEEV